MKTVELNLDAKTAAAADEALNSTNSGLDTLWVESVNVDENHVIDVKICGGDGDPWVDVVLFEKGTDGLSLHEIAVLEPQDTIYGEFVFSDPDITLTVSKGHSPRP